MPVWPGDCVASMWAKARHPGLPASAAPALPSTSEVNMHGMDRRARVREGMRVVDAEGRLLGRVSARGEGGFEIEPGSRSADARSAPYEGIAAIEGDEVRLSANPEAEPPARGP